MSNQIVSKDKAINYPINQQASYSFQNGNPTISFVLSGTPNQLLDTSSLRFNFWFRALRGSNTVGGTGGIRPSNNLAYGITVGVPPVFTAVDAPTNIDERVGVASAISTITIKDNQGNILEQISNYPRLLASIIPNSLSLKDLLSWSQLRYGSYGSNNKNQGRAVNHDIVQSQKLFCGLLMGKPIPFNILGGILRIDIELNNDNQVLQALSNPVTGITSGGGSYYQIVSPTLSFNYLTLNNPVPMNKNGFSYKHFNSYTSILNSGDNQNSLTLGISQLTNLFINYLPTEWSNSYTQTSMQTPRLLNKNAGVYTSEANLNISSMLKNNLKFPLDYEIDEKIYRDVGNFDVFRSLQYLNSIKPFNNINHCLISNKTEGIGNYSGIDDITGGSIFGTGFRVDDLNIGTSSNFSNAIFSQRLQSQNDGVSPMQMFVFGLGKNTIIPQNSGAVVVN